VFGLAGSWRMVEIIAGWNILVSSAPEEWNPILLEIINFVKNHQVGTALFLYSIPIIVLLMIIFLWGINSGYRKPILTADQSISAQDSGFKWPIEIKIIHKK
jgi:hypothetical protein